METTDNSGTLKFSNPVAKKLIAFVLLSPLPGRGGWGNGYVAVPKGHPVYEMDYDAIHDKYKISVNGGLTFSASDIIGQPEETKGMWIVGFDTLHSHDTPEMWPNSESVMAEAHDLKSQLEAIYNPVSTVKEETKHTPDYTTGPYTTSGKKNLIHIETSTDSPEAGIHICSVPKNSPNIDLLVNSWDVHARFNAIHTGAKLAKIAGTQIDPDLILHNTIGYAVQSACAETAKQNLNLLKENQELKALKAELVHEIEQLILHAEEDSLTYSVLEHARKLVYLKSKAQ